MVNHHSNDITEEEFKSFQKGCHGAFRIIFDRYHKPLYSYVFSISKDEFEAEEAVQEAFINFYSNKTRISSPSGIYPYLFVLTKRCFIMKLRRNIVQTKYNDYLHVHWNESCNLTEEQVNEANLKEILDQFIEELPPKQKKIYQLSRIEGLSCEEISKLDGCSKHTVKNQLLSASKKIKWKIEKHYQLFFLFF